MRTSCYARSLLLVFFFVTSLNTLFAFEPNSETELPVSFVNHKDSLFLIHQKSEIVATIYPGSVLKIWHADKKEEGIFKSVENGVLILTSSDKDLSINLNEINKIRVMSSLRSQKYGTVLIILGSGALLVARVIFVALSVGTGGVFDAWFFAIASVIVGPPGLVGYMGLKFGLRKRGRSFKINESRWNIQLE